MLRNASADADPVQPRTFEADYNTITRLVKELRNTTPEERKDSISALGWLCCVSGSRAQTIVRLRGSQVAMEDPSDPEGAVLVQRRWSKVKTTRRQRDTLPYKYSWTIPPPANVKKWIDARKANPDDLLFPDTVYQKRAATTLTNHLRKCPAAGIDSKITSYVFRDFLDGRLRELGLPREEIERLMEHTEETARASYVVTDISRLQAARALEKKEVKKDKTTKKAQKKKQAKASKKPAPKRKA